MNDWLRRSSNPSGPSRLLIFSEIAAELPPEMGIVGNGERKLKTPII
jgi:hypothetical protein